MLIDHIPLFGLTVATPRLTLRLPREEELAELADLAAEGIHDPGTMPFAVPWTDQPPADRARGVVQFQWLQLARSTPEQWELPLAVFRDGVVVGKQDVNGRAFAVRREIGTGSWLGQKFQGDGIGTEMRAAALHLAFAGLGAVDAVSSAYHYNLASLGVSRKLGYALDGVDRQVIRGEAVVQQRVRLTREAWEANRTVPVTIEGLEACLPMLGVGKG